MRWSSSYLGSRVRSWLRDYECLQSVAVALIYIQIGCAMVGSLGALFNGVLLINLVVALFALVAIESSSQNLGRTYAVLLFFSIVLDIAWFIFFSHTVWSFNPDQKFGPLFVFSIRLALLMEIFGFSVRFLSSFLWVQMYRLGVSTVDGTIYRTDYNVGDRLVNHPTNEVARRASTADEISGGSYSSLFEDIQETQHMPEVAMSLNDIVTSGAKPLFFLDYFATSNLDVDLAEKVIKGIVHGCQQSDCVLLGGETAEMPDFYAKGEYDLSGFAVGIVEKNKVINGKNIEAGDVLIGLPSSGVHSNGFSLVRRVLSRSGLSLNHQLQNNNGKSITLGEALMAPTIIYVKQVLDILSKWDVKGIAHITGGGFTDNIPRVFPSGLGAKIFTDSWEIPALFKWLKEAGDIEDSEMRRTFNMGIGMVLVVSKDTAPGILLECQGSSGAYRIGEVVVGEGVQYV